MILSFAFYVARLARFERATFRLGGGCSIQLSYRRINTLALYRKKDGLSTGFGRPFRFIFRRVMHILSRVFWKGGFMMRETDDPNADLEDLLFDEDAGGPSER